MYVRKETLLSSQIEGTQATLEDVLDPNLDMNCNRNVADMINCLQASDYAIHRLRELPLFNLLLMKTHTLLLRGVHVEEKSPGGFRHSQNRSGGAGCAKKTLCPAKPTRHARGDVRPGKVFPC